ncbi:MAG: hypothetical protein JO359_00445 [Candidatus Eremiobacteraeota bacterium]|nr:hypothetical protein [Candidatus Eremiobacteraeota bacterium]
MPRKKIAVNSSSTALAAKRSGNHRASGALSAKAAVRIATVSHTLDVKLAERLREFAFRQRVSESAVIEHALKGFFDDGTDAELGSVLRKAGATLRRRV